MLCSQCSSAPDLMCLPLMMRVCPVAPAVSLSPMLMAKVDHGNVLAGVVGVCCALLIAGLILANESAPGVLLIGIGLVVTILAGTLLKPKSLVTALIIASAITYLRLPVGGVNLLLDTVLVPAGLLSFMAHGHLGAFSRQFRRPEIQLLIVYLALNYAASLAFSPDKASSLNICIWLTLNLVIVALALAVFEDDKQALYRRMYVGAFIVVATGVGGWALAVTTGNAMGAVLDPVAGLRARGVSFEPNILAGSAAMWVFILLTQQRRLRKGEWLFIALAVAAIPLSTTRSALVALAAGLGVFALRMGVRVLRLVPVLLAGVVALMILQMALPSTLLSITDKFGDMRFTNQTSSYRLNSWVAAVQEMRDTDWLVGKGTNSFGQRHFDPTRPGERLPYYLGNLPLATVYDVGLIGFAVLITVALVLVVRGGPDRHLARRGAALVTFLLLSIGTSPFYFSFYWLFIALALARSKVVEPPPGVSVLPNVGGVRVVAR